MYNVENTAVCLLQEYCVLNFKQIDVKNELHSNVEMGKRKKKICGTKHSSFKLSGSTPLYWKPIITVTKSNPTCEMAEKIVFLRFDMQNQIMES